jgi:hypothetical protein
MKWNRLLYVLVLKLINKSTHTLFNGYKKIPLKSDSFISWAKSKLVTKGSGASS